MKLEVAVQVYSMSNDDLKEIDRYPKNESPLHVAAMFGLINVAQSLLEDGSNLTALNEYQQMPLHVAASENQADFVEFLCRSMRPEDLIAPATWAGLPPLIDAAGRGYLAVVKHLVEAMAPQDLTIKDNWMRHTALHAAVTGGRRSKDVVKYLVDKLHPQDLMIRDPPGRTALYIARQSSYAEICSIIEAKMDPRDLGAAYTAMPNYDEQRDQLASMFTDPSMFQLGDGMDGAGNPIPRGNNRTSFLFGSTRENQRHDWETNNHQATSIQTDSLKYCAICGNPTNWRCARCKRVWYCGREHQRQDWNANDHRAVCSRDIDGVFNSVH
jgi:hypothetical protein